MKRFAIVLAAACTKVPAADQVDASTTLPGDAAGDAGLTVPYPGLPASCQALVNHGNGECVDTWSQIGRPWEFKLGAEDAIAALDPDDTTIWGPDKTVPPDKREAFGLAVGAVFDANGVCAVWNGQELYVRSAARDYNETFSLFKADWSTRVGGHYQCEQSSTIPGAPLAVPYPPQGCDPNYVPPGTVQTMPCEVSGTAGQWVDDVRQALLALIAEEQPKGTTSLIFDFSHHNLIFQSGWEDKGFYIKDKVFLLNALATHLTPQGYCYTHNSYDTIILKRDRSLSEDYDVVQAVDCPPEGCNPDRPAGSYIRYPGRGGSCRLAEF